MVVPALTVFISMVDREERARRPSGPRHHSPAPMSALPHPIRPHASGTERGHAGRERAVAPLVSGGGLGRRGDALRDGGDAA